MCFSTLIILLEQHFERVLTAFVCPSPLIGCHKDRTASKQAHAITSEAGDALGVKCDRHRMTQNAERKDKVHRLKGNHLNRHTGLWDDRFLPWDHWQRHYRAGRGTWSQGGESDSHRPPGKACEAHSWVHWVSREGAADPVFRVTAVKTTDHHTLICKRGNKRNATNSRPFESPKYQTMFHPSIHHPISSIGY